MQTVMKSLLEMTASISLSNRAQGDPVPCYARAGRAQGKIHKFPFQWPDVFRARTRREGKTGLISRMGGKSAPREPQAPA